MFGPVVGAKVMGVTGNPKYTCLAACLFSALTMLYVAKNFEETNDDLRPIDWAACSPFAFLEFFKKTPTMARLAALALLNGLTTDMHDVKMVLLKTRLGLGADGIGRYMLGSGLSVIAAGIASNVGIKKLGQVAWTNLANVRRRYYLVYR
jgi:hypothetical protein